MHMYKSHNILYSRIGRQESKNILLKILKTDIKLVVYSIKDALTMVNQNYALDWTKCISADTEKTAATPKEVDL